MDQRIENLAKILVNYSVRIKKGEKVLIKATTEATPLLLALQKEILENGGYPMFDLTLPGEKYNFYKYAGKEQLLDLPQFKIVQAKEASAYISIISDTNTEDLANVGEEKVRIYWKNKKIKKLYDIVYGKKWVVTLYPTNALAQKAGMNLQEFEDFVYEATNIDWEKISREQKRLVKKLHGGKEVRIVGEETDLIMKIEGRKFVSCDGRENMPDGEIFISPVENSVNGHIYFNFPSRYQGTEFGKLWLKFKNGKVVDAKVEKNAHKLEGLLKIDRGASRVGEFGIGNNYNIKRYINEVLFDEKIGGTIHIALGDSYEESGGKNKSRIHWDIVKDMKKGGKIYIDGKLVYKNGKWCI